MMACMGALIRRSSLGGGGLAGQDPGQRRLHQLPTGVVRAGVVPEGVGWEGGLDPLRQDRGPGLRLRPVQVGGPRGVGRDERRAGLEAGEARALVEGGQPGPGLPAPGGGGRQPQAVGVHLGRADLRSGPGHEGAVQLRGAGQLAQESERAVPSGERVHRQRRGEHRLAHGHQPLRARHHHAPHELPRRPAGGAVGSAPARSPAGLLHYRRDERGRSAPLAQRHGSSHGGCLQHPLAARSVAPAFSAPPRRGPSAARGTAFTPGAS